MTDLIFYNLRVNSTERLKRLALHLASINSFLGGKESPSKITVCTSIRGLYKYQAARLFQLFCPSSIIRIGEENEPWKISTLMLIDALCGHLQAFRRVVYILEDWYFLGDTQRYVTQCIDESAKLSCCYTPVSVFRNGPIYDPWASDEGTILKTAFLREIDEDEFQSRSRLLRNGLDTWPVFCGGIYSPAFFEHLLLRDDDNSDKRTPFGMEYGPPLINFDIKIGILKKRLFVTFDDDQGHVGESMASRNLYYTKLSGAALRLKEDMMESNK